MTIDPIRFKRLLIKSLKLLVILEVLGAFVEGTRTGGWARFGFDLLALGILYSMWERIVARLEELKRSSRKPWSQHRTG